MLRFGFVCIILAALSACGNNDKVNAGTTAPATTTQDSANTSIDLSQFNNKFTTSEVPYVLTDSVLQQNKDTAIIAATFLKPFVADSIITAVFGKGARPKYVALQKFKTDKPETYYLVKATQGNRVAALLLTFNNEQFGGLLPFLVPDKDAGTTQVTSIDKAFTISKNISRKEDDVVIDGKEVYVYNTNTKSYELIMTDLLDESTAELINPIDTLPKTHKFAGDYIKNKKNIVSVRNGRRPNEVRVFVHFEKDNGECTGELKGDALIISSNTAVYRQGGDPCVLQFSFASSSVTLKEEEGCGSHRGVKCLFEGTYPLKKETKPKTSTKK